MHDFFKNFSIQQLKADNFELVFSKSETDLVGVFFWGLQCPNCEVAKNSLNENREVLKTLPITWYHVNVYEDFELGTRFGLHGIPTFLFFYKQKKLGRISPYPGIDPFLEALRKLVKDYLR